MHHAQYDCDEQEYCLLALDHSSTEELFVGSLLLANGVAPVDLVFYKLLGSQQRGYDYKYAYSPAKEIALFLKPYAESGASINRIGFDAVSVSPYYDGNFYSNDPDGKAFFIWSASVSNDELTEEYPDVIVTLEPIEGFDSKYDIYLFDSHMIFKLDEIESEPCIVYVKK